MTKILEKKLLYIFFTCLTLFSFLFLLVFSLKTNDEICNDNECFPRVFVAEKKFQEVHEGQEIPPGLHVKIDFNTGKKYAKILDPSDKESSEVIIISKENEDSLKNNNLEEIELDDEDLKIDKSSKYEEGPSNLNFHIQESDDDFPLPIITSNHKENTRIPNSDRVQFDLYVSQLQTVSSLQELISTLDGLEDLVHELDFGIKLAKGQGIGSILSLLDHDSAQIRKKAAIVFGTAMQNNPTAQDDVRHLNIVSRLLDNLSSETDVKVSIRLIYALSSIVRGNSNATKSFKNNNGLQRLSILYENIPNNEFRVKCALFVTDFIDPSMVKSGQNDIKQDKYQDKIINVWCKQFQDTLFKDRRFTNEEVDFDSKEKILRGISMIKSQYSNSCSPQNGFNNWLIEEELVAMKEDYLEDYATLINKVQSQFS